MPDARMPREDPPRFVEPMLARAGTAPADVAWSLELKLDGCRGQLRVDPGSWTLRSRPGRRCGDAFGELAQLADALDARSAVLDGELICLGADGKPDFHAVRERMLGRPGSPVAFAVFDLMHVDGRSTRGLPLARRRELLRELVPAGGPCWWLVSPLDGPCEEVLRAVRRESLEGVVAKRLDAPYEPGGRTGAWLKQKLRRTETFAITGWAPAREREPESVYLARVGEDGAPRRAGAAAFGLTREERELIRAAARPLRPRRTVHDLAAELRVEVDHHGRPDGPVRDAVMRRLLPAG